MFFGGSEFIIQLRDLLVVLTLFVQGLKRFLLFALNLEQALRFVLKRLEDPFFVFLFVFESYDLLDVVTAFQLAAHVFNLLFIELNFHLALLKLALFGHNLRVLLCQGCWHFGVAGLFYKVFKLAGQSFKLVFEMLVLLAQLGDDHVLADAATLVKVHHWRRFTFVH
jgi:hypothetical protein